MTLSAAYYPESLDSRGLRLWFGNWDDRVYGLKFNGWDSTVGIKGNGNWFARSPAPYVEDAWTRLVLSVENPTTDLTFRGYFENISTGERSKQIQASPPEVTEPLFVGVTIWNGAGASTSDNVYVDRVKATD